MDRLSTEREKTGVFLERHAINPLTGERLPIWAADYVLADYGTGAIMAVPAHDQRDLDFARAFELPVRVVVDTTQPATGTIPAIKPGEPLPDHDALDPVVTGVALPGEAPRPLPDNEGLGRRPNAATPRDARGEGANLPSPTDGGPARGDAAATDTVASSSCYFPRRLPQDGRTRPFDPAEAEKWAPVD